MLLAAAMCFIFTSCENDDGSGYIFKYDISGNPRTLDPQSAKDDSAILLIANIFEGLLRLDENGDVKPAVAESYTVSEDGLTYKFKLREDIFWYDGEDFEEQCTAHDFVFALKRLFNPSAKSPVASTLFCIKNSQLINKGFVPVDQLGVTADSDFELTITLDYPNPLFPVLLTTAPAMPCSEKFFEQTEGRYGLGADKIASNGAFYVHAWNYDEWSSTNNNLILRKNIKNPDNIYPYGLNFFIDEANPKKDFTDGTIHSYVASGEEAVELLSKGYEYTENDNTVWGILFNTKSIFSDDNLRKALMLDVSRQFDNAVSGYSITSSMIPQAISIVDSSYHELAGDTGVKPDAKSAKKYYERAFEKSGSTALTGLNLIAPDNSVVKNYISAIMQDWQADFSFYCNIKTMSSSAYQNALDSGDYDFALVKLTGEYNSPSSYLKPFTVSGNIANYSSSAFNALVSQAEKAVSAEESAEDYKKAEQTLLEDAIFIPICTQSEYAFFGKNCYNIIYNPFTKTMIYQDAKYIKDKKSIISR